MALHDYAEDDDSDDGNNDDNSKHLISAEIDVPDQVQILDLSYNDITTVDKNSFENFAHLKYLNLSNNALHTLDLEAFAKLRRLTELDLSNNRLEYLDERLFNRNKRLLKINLSGNKFMSLSPKKLLTNHFLMQLTLRNSQINMLHSELFAGVPNLVELDLSKNLLNNFNLEDFKSLPRLKKLNLSGNFIKCDENVKSKLKQLEDRNVNVSLDSCSLRNTNQLKPMTGHKFEKMIMLPGSVQQESDSQIFNTNIQWHLQIDTEEIDESLEDEEEEEDNNDNEFNSKKNSVRVKKNNEWLRFAPDSALCSSHNYVLCQEFRNCLQDLNKAWHEQRIQRELCPLHDIKFAFFLGIVIGISAVVILLACVLCLKNCRQHTRPVVALDNAETETQPLARPTAQLPPNVRRQPRRRTAAVARPIVRYEGPVTENFLSRLFGRPARQQYYRSINQNTATLIRRLSRSNLFNNRLSQHFMDRQVSSETSNTPSPEEYNYSPTAPRPETPPPSYGDVVINNCAQDK
ncbi:hypothetical protein DOY81_007134 [Sarcophaga bullata]|nr:hypothetical protein DOY81_007134 [Sarcophaga bullata]